jgi:hypothetical protein
LITNTINRPAFSGVRLRLAWYFAWTEMGSC